MTRQKRLKLPLPPAARLSPSPLPRGGPAFPPQMTHSAHWLVRAVFRVSCKKVEARPCSPLYLLRDLGLALLLALAAIEDGAEVSDVGG